MRCEFREGFARGLYAGEKVIDAAIESAPWTIGAAQFGADPFSAWWLDLRLAISGRCYWLGIIRLA